MKGCFRNWWTLTTTCKILFLIQTLKYSKSLTSCCCTLFSCTWWKQARFNTHNRTMDFTGPNFTKVSTKATQRRQVNVIVSFYLINPVFFVFFFRMLYYLWNKNIYTEVFWKIALLKDYGKFLGKHLCRSPFLIMQRY